MVMQKPEHFKAGFYTWTIHWSEELPDEAFGKTDTSQKRITMYKMDNEEMERETLFHELLHVALDDMTEAIFGYELEKKDSDKEENLVRLLSPQLLLILTSNPKLASFILGRGSGKRK
jgi:Zn-dependent peptidase ImmA (M78 family)